ncbi:hypothetical protein HDU67_007804, partial [Dinochytrium kinnereticum]
MHVDAVGCRLAGGGGSVDVACPKNHHSNSTNMLDEGDFLAGLLDVLEPAASALAVNAAAPAHSDQASDASPDAAAVDAAGSRLKRALRMIHDRSLATAAAKLRTNDTQAPPPAGRMHQNGSYIDFKTLPDIILLQIFAHLDGLSVALLSRACRRTHALCRDCSQHIWKGAVRKDFGHPSDLGGELGDEVGGGTAGLDWGRNVHNGRFRFDIVEEPLIKDVAKRRALVWENRGTALSRQRRYVMHCGQPTNAESGYAVNLRLCGEHICWISVKNLAVCKTSGPPVHHLEGHLLPLVCLGSNGLDTVATGGEDMTVRVWDIPSLRCIRTFHHVDALDVAVCGRSVACFTNDDVVVVWDADTGSVVFWLELRDAEAIVDLSILTREVKIQMSKWYIVCGFENTWFVTMSRETKKVTHSLQQSMTRD